MFQIHHIIDTYPNPRESATRFINEAWLIDSTIAVTPDKQTSPETETDNIRIYVPLDLNKKAILRRLDEIIAQYGEATEENEFAFEIDVERLFMQVEIYDQIWYIHHMPKDIQKIRHSVEAMELVREFVVRLENIQDIDSEYFPFRMIRELKQEYLGITD